MSILDAAAGILLVLVCAHVAHLLVALARLLLPRRRDRATRMAVVAVSAALVGEILALLRLIRADVPVWWIAGALALAALLGLSLRGAWREPGAGRAAAHAVAAAPLVALLGVVLALR